MNEWVWSNGGMILTGENWSAGGLICRTLKGLLAVWIFCVYGDFLRDKNVCNLLLIVYFYWFSMLKIPDCSSPLPLFAFFALFFFLSEAVRRITTCVICKRHRSEMEGWLFQNSTNFGGEGERLSLKPDTPCVWDGFLSHGRGGMTVCILIPEP